MNKYTAALITVIIAVVCANVYAKSKSDDLKNNIIRLHIVANSDSEADQAVKLKVRDEILNSVDTSDEYFLEKAQLCANRVLEENGFDYRSNAQLGTFYFPGRDYGGITLPSGEYCGVRVELGEARGHNWWCILYPPMCAARDNAHLTDAGRKILRESLDADTYEMVSDALCEKNPNAVVKLKTVDLINRLKNSLK